ncbi:hypothetical protein ACFWYW_48810 [Nonomuraea sp. NPDC059023]|uniref:hypothetical protein n=1 Tax=unclassified Nonomuraea TaxID=2593643 RepID=UPI0036C4F10B
MASFVWLGFLQYGATCHQGMCGSRLCCTVAKYGDGRERQFPTPVAIGDLESEDFEDFTIHHGLDLITS